MVKQVTHKQLQTLVDLYYDKKKSLIIYGRFGIGKSQALLEQGKLIAKKKNRVFIEWNKSTMAEKEDIIYNIKKYFVFLDIRLSEFDSSDIKGLPDMFKDGDSIIWKSPLFCKVVTSIDSDGMLFFDEINLAPPLVISSVYKIIYDRVINENKIFENWGIFGAGNTAEDRAKINTLAPPVRDRGGEIELIGAESDDWLDWAIANGIDSRIISYIAKSPEELYIVNFESSDKFTTYRGWDRLSSLISNITSDYELLQLVSSSAISEAVAIKFSAYCKIQELVDLDEIIKKPELLKEIKELDVRYFIITALAERYKDKKKPLQMKSIVAISEVLDDMKQTDFIALLWKMCLKYDKERFIEEFQNDETNDLTAKFAEYIIK